jgi:phosphoglycolate phosphatase
MTEPVRPKAVIFDWDDTLVDTWDVVRAALNAALVHMGHAPWTEEEARVNTGPPARVLFSRLFGEDRWQEADKVYIDAYKDNIAGKLRVHPGAAETLELLEKRGVYMAVVSSKRGPLLRQEAEHLDFGCYFGALVGAGDALIDKPDATAVHHALKGSGIGAGPHVWLVGDSQTDMQCAANAGCTSVLIETKPPSADVLSQHPPAVRVADHGVLQALLGR